MFFLLFAPCAIHKVGALVLLASVAHITATAGTTTHLPGARSANLHCTASTSFCALLADIVATNAAARNNILGIAVAAGLYASFSSRLQVEWLSLALAAFDNAAQCLHLLFFAIIAAPVEAAC